MSFADILGSSETGGRIDVIGTRLAKAAANQVYQLEEWFEASGPLPRRFGALDSDQNYLKIVYDSGIIYNGREDYSGIYL